MKKKYQKMKKKICPICKKPYLKYEIGTSPSGFKTEYWVHGYKKSPFSLGDIKFTEEISCTRPLGKED